MALVPCDDVRVEVDLGGTPLVARVWKAEVGRIPLYLLDSDIEPNAPADRELTARLYTSDLEMRIAQEILLGLGGVRALRALGYNPSVWHMNEGHSAFLALERARERFGIPGTYVLFVGGLEPRKNLVALARAFAASGVDATLVIAGGRVRWFPAEEARVWAAVRALDEPVRSRVVMTGYVSDEDKHVLLAGAEALAYPSLYEGFGFPVIEAMAAGTPVLTSNVSSLPEVAGEDALLVDPRDEQAIAHGLRRILTDRDLRERLVGPGRARAAGFTWETAARRTADVLRSVASTARG